MLELDGERRGWAGKRGTLEFIRLPPVVGVVIFKGRVTDDAVALWHDHFQWVLATEGAQLFFDGAELVAAGTRMSATAISMISKSRKQVAAAHVLVSGGLIEAIADAANLSFGGFMQIHRQRDKFEGELARALRLQAEPSSARPAQIDEPHVAQGIASDEVVDIDGDQRK